MSCIWIKKLNLGGRHMRQRVWVCPNLIDHMVDTHLLIRSLGSPTSTISQGTCKAAASTHSSMQPSGAGSGSFQRYVVQHSLTPLFLLVRLCIQIKHHLLPTSTTESLVLLDNIFDLFWSSLPQWSHNLDRHTWVVTYSFLKSEIFSRTLFCRRYFICHRTRA